MVFNLIKFAKYDLLSVNKIFIIEDCEYIGSCVTQAVTEKTTLETDHNISYIFKKKCKYVLAQPSLNTKNSYIEVVLESDGKWFENIEDLDYSVVHTLLDD